MIKKVVFLLLCSTFALQASAASLDLGFNDDSFQLIFDTPVKEDAYGISMFNARLLYNDDNETTLGSIGYDFLGSPGNVNGLDVGVGAKLYGGETDPSLDYINLGVGVVVNYTPPQLYGLGFSGTLNYAPEIFSFRDSEGLFEAGARITYTIVPKVKVYIGYQLINMDIDGGGDEDIDDDFRIGFIGTF